MKTSKALQALMDSAQEDGSLQVEQAKLDFAISLEAQRLRAKLSYADMAKELGTSAAYVSKVFRGDSNVTIESMVKLSEAAGGRLEIRVAERQAVIRPWQGSACPPIRLVHQAPTSTATVTRVSASTAEGRFAHAA